MGDEKFMRKKFLCSLIFVFVFAAGACAETVGTLSSNTAMNVKAGLWAALFDRDFKSENISIKPYDTAVLMQMALVKGEIDAFTAPEFVGEHMLKTNPEYKLRGFFISRNPIALAFGFLEEKTELRDKFSKVIEDMEEEGKIGILARDFISGPKADNPEPVKFEKFDDAETITVAVTGDMPPLDYVAADGQPAGFNTAMLAEIGRRLHVNIKIVNVETGSRAMALKSGRADAVFWFQIFTGYENFKDQPDIPEGVIVTTPYYGWNKVMFIGRQSK